MRRTIAIFGWFLYAAGVNAATPVVATSTHAEVTSPATSIDLTEPTGVASGDTLVVIVMNDAANAGAQWDDSANKPTGFTLINEAGDATCDTHIAAFWRVSDGTEGTPLNVPVASSSAQEGWYLRITGAHASAPLDVTGVDVSTSGTSHAITGVTTTVDNVLAFYGIASDGGDTGPHSVAGTGWSESDEDGVGTTDRLHASYGSKDQTTAGATGTATVTTSSSDGACSFQFGIAPTASGIAMPILDSQRRRRGQ